MRLRRNLKWGITIGLFFGLFFFVVASVAIALGAAPKKMDGTPIRLSELLVLYLGGGLAIGLLLGVLRPLARHRIAAIAIGVVTGHILALAVGLLVLGDFSEWQAPDWIGLSVYATILGVWGGNSFWKQPLPE